jgi:hypothetical protein
MTATKPHKPYSRVKVRCVELGIVYDSAAAAAEAFNCGKSAMANHLAGRFPHLRGLHFERVPIVEDVKDEDSADE